MWYENAMENLFMSSESERERLMVELETERLRLAACGVAALCDTTESMESMRLSTDNLYYSASYGDVLRRTQECIDLRSKVAALDKAFAAESDLRFRLAVALRRLLSEVTTTSDKWIAGSAVEEARSVLRNPYPNGNPYPDTSETGEKHGA